MTDSIDIPLSSSSSSDAYQRRSNQADSTDSATVAAPSTPIEAGSSGQSRPFLCSSVSTSSFDSSLVSSSPSTPAESTTSSRIGYRQKLSARDKGKMPLRHPDTPNEKGVSGSLSKGFDRRESFLSSSLSKSEHTVVNIGEPDRPRLITCVKASQGFDWNQDIFLPSYISDHSYASDLERRQDPVQDIFITDEEAEMMFPR